MTSLLARCQGIACRAARGVYSRHAKRFAREESGAVAIIFALMTVALCLFVGAAVDIGRWLHARQQTISAMDAAVLAGGRALQLDSTNINGAIDAAKKFYAQNTATRLALLSDTITFKAVENNTAFTASGNAYIATPLLSFANVPKLPLLDKAGAEFSKAQVAAGGSSTGGIEVGLMLDVTGSMAGKKITDARAAATSLVNTVIMDDQSKFSTRLALVPFAEEVRLPASANLAARGTPATSVDLSYSCGWGSTCKKTYYPTDCVVERTGTNKYTDVAPGSGNYVMTEFTTDKKCGLTSDQQVIPLTSDKTLLKNKIAGLNTAGGTAGHLGTAWAWYTLSPNWNSLWTSNSNKAAAYGTPNLQKIAILMTDGEYNTEYDSHGVQTGSTGAGSAANTDSTNQARSLCTAMKAKGITVYTVGFDLGNSKTAIETLSKCATDPTKFYNAADGNELKEAFNDIALKISQLYLTH